MLPILAVSVAKSTKYKVITKFADQRLIEHRLNLKMSRYDTQFVIRGWGRDTSQRQVHRQLQSASPSDQPLQFREVVSHTD